MAKLFSCPGSPRGLVSGLVCDLQPSRHSPMPGSWTTACAHIIPIQAGTGGLGQTHQDAWWCVQEGVRT